MSVQFAVQPSGTPVDAEARAEILANPAFGRVFTDHMVSASWTVEQGWHDAKLSAYAPISVDPASVVLHYGQTVFEGLKAYRQPGGGVALFRPERNAARMARSARRLALPEFPADAFVEALELLVRQDCGRSSGPPRSAWACGPASRRCSSSSPPRRATTSAARCGR
jgi:branched-chain amino acid aminotransferase